jgi:D-arabinose 1-dehydrogenase-like Zn-dependent alcohol dehydrogenase
MAIQVLGGADAAIVLAATPRAAEQALASLRRNGTMAPVGKVDARIVFDLR